MTRQPRKQRNRLADAPLHQRHDQVMGTLSDDLREKYDTRSVRVNAGDTVEVLRGDFAGTEGEVLAVDLKKAVIHVDGVADEKADGEETPRPLDASNLRVTDLDLSDDRRQARLEGDNE